MVFLRSGLLAATALPFSHGVETAHLAQGNLDVVRTKVMFRLVELESSLPVIETLIPLLLHFLERKREREREEKETEK